MTTTIIPHRQRGECPSLSKPMPTGDGLLARINPINGAIAPADLSGVAQAARRCGNGLLEITLRGSLQIRGLRDETVSDMNAAVEALGLLIRTGLPLDIAPLAGLCEQEHADPHPLAAAIQNQTAPFAPELGPKVSVVVDGGGPSMLAGVKADIRLTALDAKTWQVALAGDAQTARFVGVYDAEHAIQSAVALLHTIAGGGRKTRGRDLLPTYDTVQAPAQPQEGDTAQLHPGDILPLTDGRVAAVIALPFGTVTAEALIGLCGEWQALGIGELRLSPNRLLILLCADASIAEKAINLSTSFDVITRPDDPRLRIVACAGAPACASGYLNTHALGAELAAKCANEEDLPFLLHLSGCEKECARPSGTFISVIGVPGSRKIVANGIVLPPDFSDRLMTQKPMQRAS
ncbi:precorrin-3B synthase [Tianweitania sp. BSSL-BM11]|uniref:Precorrin-3B synthase n=1 Tax=Tianweitania aestuarii TaxID=2814886 RepID=A0ABS5RUG7_9HYPH|nr:precorrin-3B synthase [Tianweitania aestuarii]MBS9720592.1 precorrin-3B synthase [Tianweitania aestuarii]